MDHLYSFSPSLTKDGEANRNKTRVKTSSIWFLQEQNQNKSSNNYDGATHLFSIEQNQ